MGIPNPPYDALKAVAEWCESVYSCQVCPLNKNFGCYHPHEWPHIWENNNNQEVQNND